MPGEDHKSASSAAAGDVAAVAAAAVAPAHTPAAA